MSDATAATERSFDAFVSYSRQDRAFVQKLVAALNHYTPPRLKGVPQRRLRVFRDEADLVGSDYYESIGDNLRRARKLVLVCSPASAQSEFVNDEVERFLEHGAANDIIAVLVEGKPNNEAQPAEAGLKAFPPALCEALKLPLAIGYLGFDPRREKVHRGVREGAWYSLVASILDVSRDELEQRDRKRQLRRRNVIASIALAVIVALSALTVYAFWQRAIAVEQRTSAEARLLASQATGLLNRDESLLVRSMLLAVESVRKRPSDAAAGVLRAGLGRLGRHLATIEYEQKEAGTASSADGVFEMEYRTLAGEQYAQQAFAAAPGVEWEARVTSAGEEILRLRPDYRWGPRSCRDTPPGLSITLGEENAAGTGLRYARVRRDATGEEALLAHEGAITACAVSAAGDLVVTASGDVARELPPPPIPGDHTLRIWKLPDPALGLSEESSRTPLSAIAFAPSAPLLATAASGDNRVRVLDLEQGVEVALLPTVERDISDLAFSADGRYLASAATYGEHFEVWSVAGFEKVATLAEYTSEGAVDFSPDGRYLVTDFGELTHPTGSDLWDLSSKLKLSRFGTDPRRRTAMSFSADARWVFTMESQRLDEPPWSTARFLVWDAAANEVITTVAGVEAYAVSGDGGVLVLRMTSNDVYNERDDTFTAEAGSGDLQVWLMRPEPLRARVIAARASGSCLALGPDGRYLAYCRNDKTVRLLDLAEEAEPREFRQDETVLAVAFSPDGRHLAIATYAYGGQEANAFRLANVLVIRDVQSGERVTTLSHQGLINELGFSADGRYVGSNTYQSEESGFAPAHVWLWRFEDLIEQACRSLPRNLTREEWNAYVAPGEPYRPTCENLPEHPSARHPPVDAEAAPAPGG